MIYIKSYKVFESIEDIEDDYDIMARYQIFSSECFVSFYYRSILIRDKNEISNLIKTYNDENKKSKEWLGGPVNRNFDEYFFNKYKSIIGGEYFFNKNSKPQLGLTLKTEYGFLHTGFSVKDKKMATLYTSLFDLSEPEFKKDIINLGKVRVKVNFDNEYQKKVVREIYALLKKYWNSDLETFVSDMNLDINFDWTWED